MVYMLYSHTKISPLKTITLGIKHIILGGKMATLNQTILIMLYTSRLLSISFFF